MKIIYSLDEHDLLASLLFEASKSEGIKKGREKSWVINTIALFGLSAIFYINNSHFLAWYSLALGVLAIFFFPSYTRHRYKNHYKKYVQEKYKDRIGVIETLVFGENALESSDVMGDSTINLAELEEINETGEYFFLKLKRGVGRIVIPKSKIDQEELRDQLVKMSTRLNIAFIPELTWKWK